MDEERKKELTALFKAEASDRGAEIDPDDEYDWYSLTIGWALAKGLTPDEAVKFSIYIRYSTELG